jgi:membrane protein required for colicin V production
MSFLDIVLGGLLGYAVFKGIRNGLFVEMTSFISLLIGIYIAVKFSSVMKNALGFLDWNPNTVQVTAFVLTFVLVVIGIYFLGKFLTGLANFAHLGWLNKLGGGFFRMIKFVLIISVFLNLFEKINYHNFLAKKETLDKSIFYNPIQKTAAFIFPSIKKWYDGDKKK